MHARGGLRPPARRRPSRGGRRYGRRDRRRARPRRHAIRPPVRPARRRGDIGRDDGARSVAVAPPPTGPDGALCGRGSAVCSPSRATVLDRGGEGSLQRRRGACHAPSRGTAHVGVRHLPHRRGPCRRLAAREGGQRPPRRRAGRRARRWRINRAPGPVGAGHVRAAPGPGGVVRHLGRDAPRRRRRAAAGTLPPGRRALSARPGHMQGRLGTRRARPLGGAGLPSSRDRAPRGQLRRGGSERGGCRRGPPQRPALLHRGPAGRRRSHVAPPQARRRSGPTVTCPGARPST